MGQPEGFWTAFNNNNDTNKIQLRCHATTGSNHLMLLLILLFYPKAAFYKISRKWWFNTEKGGSWLKVILWIMLKNKNSISRRPWFLLLTWKTCLHSPNRNSNFWRNKPCHHIIWCYFYSYNVHKTIQKHESTWKYLKTLTAHDFRHLLLMFQPLSMMVADHTDSREASPAARSKNYLPKI